MGTYRSPDVIKSKTAEAIAKTTEQVASAAAQYVVGVENRKKLRQLEENKINEDLYGVNKGISDIPKADDIGLDESMRTQLKGRMDELYRLGKEVAKGGSNEEYLKYKAETESLVQSIPDEIKSINYYSKMLDEGLSNGKFLEGTTDPNFVEFLMKWNEDGGSGVTTEFINGKMVLKKNGTIVNTSNLLRDANKGGGINFVENPMEELETIFKGAVDYEEYKRLDTVVKQNGGTVTKEVEANYEKANQIARDYFDNVNIIAGSENDPLRDELNQNNWDYFIAGGDPTKGVYDRTDPKQVKQLREAVVNNMMSKFGKEDVILKQKSKSPASKSGSGSSSETFTTSQKAEIKTRQKDYTKDFDQVKTIAGLTSRSAKKEALVKAANANAGKSGPVLKYKDGEIYKLITSGAKTVEVAEPLDINVGKGGYYEMQSLLNDYRPDPISSEVMGYFRNEQLGRKTSKVTAEKQATQEVKNNNDPAGLGI